MLCCEMWTHARSAVRLARAGPLFMATAPFFGARPLLLVLAEKGEAAIGRRCGFCAGGLCIVLMARSTASRLTIRGGIWRKNVLCTQLHRGMAAVAHLHTVDSTEMCKLGKSDCEARAVFACAVWCRQRSWLHPPAICSESGRRYRPFSAPLRSAFWDHAFRTLYLPG
jgi:hypothetical protein